MVDWQSASFAHIFSSLQIDASFPTYPIFIRFREKLNRLIQITRPSRHCSHGPPDGFLPPPVNSFCSAHIYRMSVNVHRKCEQTRRGRGAERCKRKSTKNQETQ